MNSILRDRAEYERSLVYNGLEWTDTHLRADFGNASPSVIPALGHCATRGVDGLSLSSAQPLCIDLEQVATQCYSAQRIQKAMTPGLAQRSVVL